jgi:hypothetical protein
LLGNRLYHLQALARDRAVERGIERWNVEVAQDDDVLVPSVLFLDALVGPFRQQREFLEPIIFFRTPTDMSAEKNEIEIARLERRHEGTSPERDLGQVLASHSSGCFGPPAAGRSRLPGPST